MIILEKETYYYSIVVTVLRISIVIKSRMGIKYPIKCLYKVHRNMYLVSEIWNSQYLIDQYLLQ